MDFSRRLKEERESKGLTQVDLANKLNISKQTVYKYERGIAIPSVPTLLEMADMLDCSMDYLFGRTDSKSVSWLALFFIAYKMIVLHANLTLEAQCF